MISWIFFSLFVSVLGNEKLNRTNQRIFYGDTVKIEDYPFYAGLYNCGAVILSDIWILTAAHCVVGRRPNYVWVGGESYSNSKIVTYNQVIVHEQYNDDSVITVHDIALIKLSNPLEFSEKVQPIKLPNMQFSDTKVTFVGRGFDETKTISEVLKKVDLVRLTPEQCIRYIPTNYILYYDIVKENIKYLSKAIVCAKREDDLPSICKGDSGGPLFNGDTLVGLASFIGPDCAKNRLGFYVNVASYVPWIKEHTDL